MLPDFSNVSEASACLRMDHRHSGSDRPLEGNFRIADSPPGTPVHEILSVGSDELSSAGDRISSMDWWQIPLFAVAAVWAHYLYSTLSAKVTEHIAKIRE